jgi:catechol 2,3-dioxygenase-like lactoylglutathione lyase family enzyme
MIKYQSVVLICEDVRVSLAFYQKLFNLEVELDIGGLVNFKEGISLWGQKIASELVYNGTTPSAPVDRPRQELYFETDDIDGFFEILQRESIRCLHPIQKAPWHQRTVRFFDPDQNLIEVGESMEEVIRRFEKEGKTTDQIAELTMMPIDVISTILK